MDGSAFPINLDAKPNDLESFWMPFTWNREFKRDPLLLASAEGMHYRSVDGREILDGTAGLWCCNAGHGRREIAEAVSRQISQMDFAPTFQMGHPLPFELAERLADIAPQGLNRVFFTNSGSEAVESAMTIIAGQVDFSIDANAVHGSDGPDTAREEIAFFFGADEIYSR